MTTYVLIPGAGGDAWYWHLLEHELLERGHETVAVDLPADQDSAGLAEYADAVVGAIGDRTDLVVVAQSLGGFTAPLVCARVPVNLLVMLNAMVPAPGESAGEWWDNTGQAQARAEHANRDGRDPADESLMDAFFHDVPPEVTAEAWARGAPCQSGTPFEEPWPLAAWPDVPMRFLQGRDDRFFPLEFQRRVVRERLGITLDEMAGGHLVALARPKELADRLEAYREDSADRETGEARTRTKEVSVRRVVAVELVSLDGVMEAPEEWAFSYSNDEMEEANASGMAASDAMLLGRVTYEGLAAFWPNQPGGTPMVDYINSVPKYVVSTTLEEPLEWNNSTLIRGNIVEEVAELKRQPGKDITIIGSSALVRSLLQDGLLDELRLMVHPVVMGTGKRIFEEWGDRKPLELVDAKTFATGVLALTYRPAGQEG